MAVGGIGSFNTLTSYSGISNSKTNSELKFDKIYQQKTDSVEINSTAGNNDIMTIYVQNFQKLITYWKIEAMKKIYFLIMLIHE
jgi:hypothetical protein